MRILLADDSAFWRAELQTILETEPGWTVFQATNGAEAVQRSISIHPDSVILDVCMPVLDGLSAARQFQRMWPEVPVLILTADKNAFVEVKARECGAVAVFSKMECLELRKFLRNRFLAAAA